MDSGWLWEAVCGVPAFRVVELPRREVDLPGVVEGLGEGRPDERSLRVAALVQALYARDRVVGVGWFRPVAGGPVDFVVAGAGLAEVGVPVRLSLPSGGRGEPLAGGLSGALAGLPFWCRVAGVHDALLLPRFAARPRSRTSLEDGLLSVWGRPFGWLLVAVPVADEVLREMAVVTALEQRGALSKGDKSPVGVVEAERLGERYRELALAQSTGLWEVHLLAGGASAADAVKVAALVGQSMDLDGLPYVLRPSGAAGPGAEAVRSSVEGSPFTAGVELVAALAQPPVQEVAGARLVLPPRFDQHPETGGEGVGLGVVLDRQRNPAGPFTVAAESVNRHVFVCGATGAGKSNTIRTLLEQATREGIPWLVVEPAKAEYAAMAARGVEVIVVRPGAADQVAAGINPLEPAVGADGRRFPLQTHADLLRALFVAAFASEEPFPQVLSAALTRCYEDLGWDLALGEPRAAAVRPRYPTLEDLQAAAERVVEEVGYGREIRDNVRGFIRVRLASLRLGVTGRFLQGGHRIDFEDLLARNVVFEIEDVGDDHDKAFFMGTVLLRLAEHLRLTRAGGVGLRHVTVIEEAHRLLRRSEDQGAAAHAVEMFASLLAEVRAYGEGLIIADQIPAKLVPDVIKNTAVKIVHQLPAADDRQVVGATMNLSDAQSQYLVTLPPGEAAVFAGGMDFPLLVRMPDGSSREREPAETADPAAVVRPRSRTCPAVCGPAPCTLRQMATARRTGEDDPRLVVWAELAVLGHLAGQPMPVPGRSLLSALRGMEVRLRDCAIGHAVDTAVDHRSRAVARAVSPDALAGHVTDAIRARLDGAWLCAATEPQWQIAEYAESAVTPWPGGRAGRPPRRRRVEDPADRGLGGLPALPLAVANPVTSEAEPGRRVAQQGARMRGPLPRPGDAQLGEALRALKAAALTRLRHVGEQKWRTALREASTYTRSHCGAVQTPRRPARLLPIARARAVAHPALQPMDRLSSEPWKWTCQGSPLTLSSWGRAPVVRSRSLTS